MENFLPAPNTTLQNETIVVLAIQNQGSWYRNYKTKKANNIGIYSKYHEKRNTFWDALLPLKC
jgi:hypothetical protein